MEEKEATTTTQELPESTEKHLSKNQLKKLKKREKWMETRKERKAVMKQRKKEKLAEKRKNGEDLGINRKSLKSNTMKNSSCKIRVALDLSLEEYMSEKDIVSLTCQIQHCYSANRRAENPMQLYACGVGGHTQERLDIIGDYKGWDINFREESYLKTFPKESIVYLSSESSNVLTTLSEDKVYVIGGLVDHNFHKGLCHRLAEENGVDHAQLPISEFITLKGRKVLAINHVFSILLRFTATGDWKQAFSSEVPTRKGYSPNFGDKEVTGEDSNAVTDDDKESVSSQKNESNEDCSTDAKQEVKCQEAEDASENVELNRGSNNMDKESLEERILDSSNDGSVEEVGDSGDVKAEVQCDSRKEKTQPEHVDGNRSGNAKEYL